MGRTIIRLKEAKPVSAEDKRTGSTVTTHLMRVCDDVIIFATDNVDLCAKAETVWSERRVADEDIRGDLCLLGELLLIRSGRSELQRAKEAC